MSTTDTVGWLNSLPPTTFMDQEKVRTAFIKNCMNVRGLSEAESDHIFNKEAMYFRRLIHASEDLRNCSVFSLYCCLIDISLNAEILSFNPDDKLVYVETRGHKTGAKYQDGRDIYEKRAQAKISPYGELAIRMDVGQIKYADDPIVVYDGDLFEIGTDDYSNTRVLWKAKVPRKPNARIIGAFIKITRPNDSYITPYMLEDDVMRLAAYSERQNKRGNTAGKANPLYGIGTPTGIDAGFLKAKMIKHSFRTFPKVRIKANNSSLDDMDTSIDPEDNGPAMVTQYPPAAHITPRQPAEGAPPAQQEQQWQSHDPYGPNYRPPVQDEYSGTF